MRVGLLTHQGCVRPNNEDNIYSSTNKDILIVADGMGGHKAGEVASRAAINKIRYFIKTRMERYPKDDEGIQKLLRDAIAYANAYIFNMASSDIKYKGMGTTVIAAVILDKKVYLGHVGDSRAYIINNECINQITTDHSLVQELLKTGSITKEEAESFPHRNIITRALGIEPNVVADTYIIEISNNDTLLLCTDGLSSMLTNEEIKNIVESETAPNKTAKKLIDMANAAGGSDNISVIIAKNDN